MILSTDYLEKPGKLVENVRDNLFAPIALAILCKDRGIHFTYMGTGCIFNFDENHPYG
jgi:3,5-epimerase/4-reductase